MKKTRIIGIIALFLVLGLLYLATDTSSSSKPSNKTSGQQKSQPAYNPMQDALKGLNK